MGQTMIDKLEDINFKFTPTRKKIVDFLDSKAGSIFSALEVWERLKKTNKASIYRTLKVLENSGIIRPIINLKGNQFYELEEGKHHHHVICTGCLDTECVPCNITLPKLKKFYNLKHTFVLTGLCAHCANK